MSVFDRLHTIFSLFKVYLAPSLECNCPLAIQDLEAKIDALIQLCEDLERRAASLERDKSAWQEERSRLIEQKELAKSKVEAMISRLKALEQE